MKFKIDENLHPDVAALLNGHGHDAMTVYDQGLRGKSDDVVADVCREEGRVLLTLDLDFADVREFPPGEFAGIIVFRLPQQSRGIMLAFAARILAWLASEPLAGKLWIVDEHRIRVRG